MCVCVPMRIVVAPVGRLGLRLGAPSEHERRASASTERTSAERRASTSNERARAPSAERARAPAIAMNRPLPSLPFFVDLAVEVADGREPLCFGGVSTKLAPLRTCACYTAPEALVNQRLQLLRPLGQHVERPAELRGHCIACCTGRSVRAVLAITHRVCDIKAADGRPPAETKHTHSGRL